MSIADWLMFATAVATAVAAWAAARGARATRDAARGQLLSELYDEFWSDEFRLAVRRLADLGGRLESSDDAALADALADFRDDGGTDRAGHDSTSVVYTDRHDSARRRVKGYFYKLYRFEEAGLLSEAEVRDLLTSEIIVRLLLVVVEPVEKSLSDELGRLSHESYERKSREKFDFFDDLYDRRIERPLR